jgi:hypothetical protein
MDESLILTSFANYARCVIALALAAAFYYFVKARSQTGNSFGKVAVCMHLQSWNINYLQANQGPSLFDQREDSPRLDIIRAVRPASQRTATDCISDILHLQRPLDYYAGESRVDWVFHKTGSVACYSTEDWPTLHPLPSVTLLVERPSPYCGHRPPLVHIASHLRRSSRAVPGWYSLALP